MKGDKEEATKEENRELIRKYALLRASQRIEDAKIISENLNKTEKWLESADENGLFKKRPEIYKTIIESICAARRELDQDLPNTIEAYEHQCSANHLLNQAINDDSLWWRFKYSFGGHVLLYFVAISMSIFLAWYFFSDVILDSKILWVPSWAFLWGSMGGILHGIWRLWQHVSDRYLRKPWLIWFVLLPLMGAIFGALAYLIFFAGFVATTGEAQIDSEFFVMLLSALAGFSSKWAVEMLNKLTTIVQIGGK